MLKNLDEIIVALQKEEIEELKEENKKLNDIAEFINQESICISKGSLKQLKENISLQKENKDLREQIKDKDKMISYCSHTNKEVFCDLREALLENEKLNKKIETLKSTIALLKEKDDLDKYIEKRISRVINANDYIKEV